MKPITLAVCAILPAVWKSPEEYVGKFVRNVFQECARLNSIAKTVVILSVEMVGRENWKIFQTLQLEFPNFILLPAVPSPKSMEGLYLTGFALALENDADLVLELDCSGAHEASEIPEFLRGAADALANDSTQLISVMSTRFSSGGKDHFPADRVFLSKAGTLFAHLLLQLGSSGKKLTDLTSGFEAFSGNLLRRMFELQPVGNWVTVRHGPLHLFQTEARALVCWIAAHENVSLTEKPITFGANFTRKLAPLTFKYLFRAFMGGMLLAWDGFKIRNVLTK